jgi:uncharacterized protein YdhG (YjbR/CyaY superfamily)
MDSTKKDVKTIDEYILSYPIEVQRILKSLRRAISEVAPQSEEVISYGIPTFKLNGNLVHFAAYKNHIGFYPTPSGIEAFKEELSKYKLTKGTIQFSLGEPLPLDLIRKIVEFRVSENKGKKR